MNILGIVGSKRKKGNTALLIEQAIKPFIEEGHETETIFLGDLSFEGCRGCEGCSKTNRCVLKDEMQLVYDKIRAADAVIAGSPTYFYNMTSDMKKFIDRCYCFCSFDPDDRSVWSSEFEHGPVKYMGLISICEQDNFDDMGFTPKAMESAYKSLGFRIVFSQKVLHAFKAGEATEKLINIETAENNGRKLLKTLSLR